jgi:demethylmenaquinone methyltransferase/2-methoxy-6-polyprenyl-1,4-benzoquinol methylase
MTDEQTSTTNSGKGAIQSKADVQAMFDKITPRYDLMNRIMTGGMDERWRKRVAKLAIASAPDGHPAVLDVATGTGDLAFAIANAGASRVVGLDFSIEMIDEARRKSADQFVNVEFIVGDAMQPPLPEGTFDACTVSFGLRNMPDYDEAIRSMTRMLKPGGTFICLEMTPFHRPVVGPLFQFYFKRVMPLVGGVLSGSRSAYSYLPESVENFPTANDLADRMRNAGLEDVTYALLGMGTVAIHTGKRAV